MMQERNSTMWLSSFGRRKGRAFKSSQKTFLTDTLHDYAVILPETPGEVLHLEGLFGVEPEKLWLEIGFGGGEHLAAQAEKYPEVSFIGCEPYMDGVAHLLKLIENSHLKNVRIWKEDARFLLEALPDHSLDRVFILFPDPWPKKRHHKRRLIAGPLLDLLAAKMVKQGELRIATDHQEYAEWILEHVSAHPVFGTDFRMGQEWKNPPDDWIRTRYQQKAEEQGLRPFFFCFTNHDITHQFL